MTTRIRSWWSSISYLPNWGQPLRYFMSGTIGMASGIIFGDAKPRIVWEKIPTAYADQKNNKIGISASMFSETPSERMNPGASKDDSMQACMGFLAHEMAHFVWSPPTIPGLFNPGIPHTELLGTLANIVEDVFIEDAIVKRESSFGWMISAAWDYVFPVDSINERLEKWDGVSLVDLDAVLNVMACWKNQEFPFEFRSEFESELHTKLMSAKGMYDLQQRKDLIEEIYHFLLDARKEETGEDLEEMIAKRNEEFDKLAEALKKLLEDFDFDEVQPTSDGEMVKVKVERSFYRRDESDALIAEQKEKFSDFEVDGKVIVSWVSPDRGGKGKLTFDKKWKEFARWAADQGTVRRVRGPAGIKGRLTHPANIYDTGKVYSKAALVAPNGTVASGGAPQDIILIDFSGSMSGGVYGTDGTYTTKHSEACRAAQGAMEGLLAAKHRVAIYGHTTGIGPTNEETCLIREIKNFQDNVDAGSAALYNVVQKGAESSNADSYAITAVGKKFKRDGSPMRLWVISDGQPACSLYAGNSGIKATKKAVDNLRSQGVEVYSFSIDSYAISANNEIYGTKNNFNAQDIDVVRKVLRLFV